MTTPRKSRLSAALLVALLSAPFAVAAQAPEDSADVADAAQDDDQATESPSSSSATGAQELEAVTVSARRRDESLQDVPVAVSAFEMEDLRDMQARNLDGLQGAVPNLNIVQ